MYKTSQKFQLCLSFLFLFFCIAPIVKSQTYNFNHYSLKDGLIQSNVNDILQDKKGYISPQVVNLYIGKFANFVDEPNEEEEITNETKPYQKPKKVRNFVINYGLPVIGGTIGYFVAKKTDADEKKMIGFILFFGLLGFLPRYLYKK